MTTKSLAALSNSAVNYKYLHSILQSDYICIKGVEIFVSKCGIKKGRGIPDHFVQLHAWKMQLL